MIIYNTTVNGRYELTRFKGHPDDKIQGCHGSFKTAKKTVTDSLKSILVKSPLLHPAAIAVFFMPKNLLSYH